jgi:hypothetical protein
VLYNQIDPLWRWIVPNFTEVMAGAINREIFLQTLGEQQAGLDVAAQDIDLIMRALDLAIEAAESGDRVEARRHVQEALAHSDDLEGRLAPLGPEVVVSYLLPATYGIALLQDVMLRGGPGNAGFLLALTAIAMGLFLACLGLLQWRTRPR